MTNEGFNFKFNKTKKVQNDKPLDECQTVTRWHCQTIPTQRIISPLATPLLQDDYSLITPTLRNSILAKIWENWELQTNKALENDFHALEI